MGNTPKYDDLPCEQLFHTIKLCAHSLLYRYTGVLMEIFTETVSSKTSFARALILGTVLIIIGHMWFSVFLSWLAKRAILSYGGSRAYRGAIPLFLGFIIGQFFMGSLWSVIGVILNKNMYTLFP